MVLNPKTDILTGYKLAHSPIESTSLKSLKPRGKALGSVTTHNSKSGLCRNDKEESFRQK